MILLQFFRSMRPGRFAAVVVFAVMLSLAPFARAQENAAAEEKHEPGIGWQVANFIILAGFLGYMVKKNAGKFFDARTGHIQSGIYDAAKAKRDSEARLADVERRIAGLGSEIEKMRADMRKEMAAEGERIRLETERHIHRVQEQAAQDIESMIKAGRRDLKTYSAELALKMAEEQLHGRITHDVENNLVSSFISDLRAKSAAGNNNN